MAYGNIWRFLLIIIAVCSTQAQQEQQTNIPNSDEIVFPGPTARPDRFPINPQKTTPWPQGQGPAENQPATTSSPDIASTTPSAAYNRCFNKCPSTSEYNPLCGTDDIVYTNPGRLLCAQTCGKQVEVRRRGSCTSGQSVP